MNDDVLLWIVVFATVSAGLMAGVYFAFSTFIMSSFQTLEAGRAVDAMNAINRVILTSWFMPLFFGSTLLHLILLTAAWLDVGVAGRLWLVVSGLSYVIGMFFCTLFFNVPLNRQLDRAGTGAASQTISLLTDARSDRSSAGQKRNDSQGNERIESVWHHYRISWTRWNHVRCVASFVAMGSGLMFIVASVSNWRFSVS